MLSWHESSQTSLNFIPCIFVSDYLLVLTFIYLFCALENAWGYSEKPSIHLMSFTDVFAALYDFHPNSSHPLSTLVPLHDYHDYHHHCHSYCHHCCHGHCHCHRMVRVRMTASVIWPLLLRTSFDNKSVWVIEVQTCPLVMSNSWKYCRYNFWWHQGQLTLNAMRKGHGEETEIKSKVDWISSNQKQYLSHQGQLLYKMQLKCNFKGTDY